MVYRRRRFRGRRRFGRRRFRRSKGSFYKRVKRIVRNTAGETKFVNNESYLSGSGGMLEIQNHWTEKDIVTISQGAGSADRNGNQIILKSLWIEGTLVNAASGAEADDPAAELRIVLALWKEGAGATPLTSQASVPALSSPMCKGDYNMQYLIKKYYDKTKLLNVSTIEKNGAGTSNGYAWRYYRFKYYKRFKKPITITWGGNNYATPNMRLVLSARSNISQEPYPGFQSGFIRYTYKDA